MRKATKKMIVLLALLPVVCALAAQQQLIYTESARSAIYHEDGLSITPLFEYRGEFRYNGKFLTYKVPPEVQGKTLALGFVFYTGGPKQEPANALILLVAGYDTNEPEFYSDNNFNYIFEKDEKLTEGGDGAGHYYFTVRNPSAKNASYSFRIKRLAIPTERSMSVTNFYKNKAATAGNVLTPTDFWFSNERLNIISARITAGGREYKIGLLDGNANGLYNDPEGDKILIADKEGRFGSFTGPGTFEISRETLISLGDISFAVKDIDPAGSSFLLEKASKTGNSLVIGGKIPDFTIPMLTGENKSVRSLLGNKPYTLLDFWGSWCKGCLQQLTELMELQLQYSEDLQVIGLNKGDSKETALKFIKEKAIGWKQGIATDEITGKLMIDGYPYYLLLDQLGKIIGAGADIKNISKLLKKME